MANLPVLQTKIRKGYKIYITERRTMTTTLDDRGVQSERRWKGFNEYPKSNMDRKG